MKSIKYFGLNLLILLVLSQGKFVFAAGNMNSSNYSGGWFSERFFWGGSLGLTLGDITQIDILPVSGLWIIPQWAVGVGGRYSYYSQRSLALGDFGKRYRTHIWGASAFTQILPVVDFSESTPIPIRGGVMFHGEYERLYIDRGMVDPTQTEGKTWNDLFLVGVGYRQRVGEKAALNIMLLWHFADNFTPYPQNPILRVNITI